MLEKVYESHNKWINTVLKLGANKHEAQDIVGNMYLTIGQMLNKGLDISYGDDVNYFYIYKNLLFTNVFKKEKRKQNLH